MKNTSHAIFFKGEHWYKMTEYVKSQHNSSMLIHEVCSYDFEVGCVVGCDVRATGVNWPCFTIIMN